MAMSPVDVVMKMTKWTLVSPGGHIEIQLLSVTEHFSLLFAVEISCMRIRNSSQLLRLAECVDVCVCVCMHVCMCYVFMLNPKPMYRLFAIHARFTLLSHVLESSTQNQG